MQLCHLHHYLHITGGTPGVGMAPSVPVAAVAEFTLCCPANALWCSLVGLHWGLRGFEEAEYNHSVYHQERAPLQELSHRSPGFNRTDYTPGLLAHPCGTRVAPISTLLAEGEWMLTHIILSSLPGFFSSWRTPLCLLHCKPAVQTDNVVTGRPGSSTK